jgi:hypothetical protein
MMGIAEILDAVRPYTMLDDQRIVALVQSVINVTAFSIPGAFVECGVWRGGAALAMILALQGKEVRDIYLFDTFAGMTKPGFEDVDFMGHEGREGDCAATASEVLKVLGLVNYWDWHLVVGRVEETIPALAPQQIALLHLDTDWYASTKHELQHLYPCVSRGGIVIIDDYGHWQGARKAVNEYRAENRITSPLIECGYTARLLIKE